MILLDTNIISTAINPLDNEPVRGWIDRQAEGSLFLCAPVLAELRFGVALLSEGRRKAALAAAYDRLEEDFFSGRVLPFDKMAAYEFATFRAKRRKSGIRLGSMDALIASIARANSMVLATRNIKDFKDLGLTLINPFEAPTS